MEPLNPVSVEQMLRETIERISRGIGVVSKRHRERDAAKREFDRAYAVEFLDASGSVEERKQKALLATLGERESFELADEVHREADKLLRALDSELSALQTISAMIRDAYRSAGVGE